MAVSQYPDFRFFATARDYAPTPQWDLPKTGCTGEGCAMACDAEPCNQWLTVEQATKEQPGKLPKSPLPNTFLANFSAVCFLTARDIARMHTSNRPTALIQAAWGGTRVEAWMSKEAIAAASSSAGASPPASKGPNQASGLYNAMIAPWNKFAVRAALYAAHPFAQIDRSPRPHPTAHQLKLRWMEVGDRGALPRRVRVH